MRYSDLFDREFWNLANVRDDEVEGLLARVNFIQLHEKVETQSINYFDSRHLQPEGIYVPFTSMPFDCSREEVAVGLFKSCINQLEILVINSLKGEAKKNDENVKLPEEQFIRNFYFDNKNCEVDLLTQINKYKGRSLVCVSSASVADKLSQILKTRYICGGKMPINVDFIPNSAVSDDKIYIFEVGKVTIGCAMKFKFYSRPNPNKAGSMLCQVIGAVGAFDATRFDEESVVIVETEN